MNIVDEVRAILIAAKPANSNQPQLRGDLRPATLAQVNYLIAELDSLRPRRRNYERIGRVITNPAPWVRHMVKSAG